MEKPKIRDIYDVLDYFGTLYEDYYFYDYYEHEHNRYKKVDSDYVIYLEDYIEKVERLEKAFKTACKELERDGKMINFTKDMIIYSTKATAQEWEEYLLDDN